jgi:hypothetical protein
MEYSTYEDLLSYKDIDLAVDRLLRALLDTLLVQRKREATSKEAFAKAASGMRADWLKGESRKIKDSAGYLYWFDIRALYWAENAADDDLANLLADPETLTELYKQAVALQQRFALARKLGQSEEGEGYTIRRVVVGEPPTAEPSGSTAVLDAILVATKPHKPKPS